MINRIPNQQPGRAQKRAMVARYKRTAEGRALMAKLQATHRQARLQAAQTQLGFGVTAKAVDRSNAALKHEDTYAITATTATE